MSDVSLQVRLTVSRYLPGVFAEAMRESGAAAAVHMLDANHEHPELVWSDDARRRVCGHVAALRDRYERLGSDSKFTCKMFI